MYQWYLQYEILKVTGNVRIVRILFIEEGKYPDADLLQELYKRGHCIDHFYNLLIGDRALAMTSYCAIIADMPPGDICTIRMVAYWRRKGIDIPIMILAHEGIADRRTAVINAGADDCMEAKPNPMELIARIGSIVRRSHSITSAQLQCGGVIFDTLTREVFVEKKLVRLTAKEIALLEIFMMNSKRLLSKKYLEEKICSWQRSVCSNVVEVYVSSLRKKIGRDAIQTIHGQGYVLTDCANIDVNNLCC